MEKIIRIGEKEVRLNNNVAWTMEYRDQFGKDIVPALMPILASMIEGVATITGGRAELSLADIFESLEGRVMDILLPMFQMEFVDTVIDVTWAMAKAANEDIDPPKAWVRQFETFPLDIVLPAVGELILKGFVSSKNLQRLKGISESLKSLQPSLSTISSSQDLNED